MKSIEREIGCMQDGVVSRRKNLREGYFCLNESHCNLWPYGRIFDQVQGKAG